MLQMLEMMMADREAERAERQANIAALQQLAQNNNGHGNHDHPGSKLKKFQNTNPPIFNKTEEPLDADDWLQTMENNLEVAGVEANEKNYRPNYPNNHGGSPKPGGNNNNNHTSNNNPNNNNNNNGNNNNTGPRTGSNAIPVANKDKATITCYECGVVGHYSNECPKRLAKIAGNTAAPAQNQRRFAARKNQNNNGRYYNMTATKAQEAPQNMPSMFSC
ncbi:hypothetical protein QYE76_030296 [Lolium multiflorum]|uniref:CCHC-type domain-containing protein n=1 Tax=Lolium multiflorum TaxID=4521 RepID=A0AAD8QPI1_LOLMU|nr:hypothetical protein QYE76_030296 [Lolium multiflorum]